MFGLMSGLWLMTNMVVILATGRLSTDLGMGGGEVALEDVQIGFEDMPGLIDEVLARHGGLDPADINDVILGVVSPVGEQGGDIARTAATVAGAARPAPLMTFETVIGETPARAATARIVTPRSPRRSPRSQTWSNAFRHTAMGPSRNASAVTTAS